MIVNLEIFADSDNGVGVNGTLLRRYEHVDVTWRNNGLRRQEAIASKNGVDVARMGTFDDYPIEIETDSIVISGVDASTYGVWRLSKA